MANEQAIQEAILRAVDTIVTQRNSELKLDETIIAIIKDNIGVRDNRNVYRLQYNGSFIEAICQNKNDFYLSNTSVYVLIPQGNFSNEKIIIGLSNSNDAKEINKTTKFATRYAKLSSNLLFSDENISYGLHSWHENNNIEDADSSHQYQYLYKREEENNPINFDSDILKIYKNDMIALMIQADFQTLLDTDQKQKINASYGLIFNFVFNTLNKTYGETNGEIFDNLALEMIKELADYDEIFNKNEDNFSFIDSSLLYQYINKIERLYTTFKKEHPELDFDWIKNIISSYLKMLNRMAKVNTSLNQKIIYDNWRKTKIGEPNCRYEQFILSSNNMTGDPFSFSNWNKQQYVFKIDSSKLNNLDSIIFFQEGFNQDYVREQNWPNSNKGGPDILVKNIQLYALKLAGETEDYTLVVEPENEAIITQESDILTFKASLVKNYYEDLTSNIHTEFYWFKESSQIINANDDGYNKLAGIGWQEIESARNQWIFSTRALDNQAINNNYKCIAVYNNYIIEYNFTIYRSTAIAEIKLESDLGTEFAFNMGTPTISVKIKDEYNNDFSELTYSTNFEPAYKYNWCIISDNENKIFLKDNNQNILSAISQETSFINIKKQAINLKGEIIEVSNQENASRIHFPVSSINNSCTIICYVQKRDTDNDNYFDIGSAQLTIFNKDINIDIADYVIELENDNQIFKYDIYGKSPIDPANKNPIEIKPLYVKLLTASGIEVHPENYTVEWIFPTEETTLLILENSSKYGCSFNIKKDYDINCYDNQITCHIQFGGKHFYKDTNFYFGKEGDNGTNGTDVVAKIEYAKEDDYYNLLSKEPVTLYTCITANNKIVSFINTDQTRSKKESQLIFDRAIKTSNEQEIITATEENLKPLFKSVLYQRSNKIDYLNNPVYSLAGGRKGKYFRTDTTVFWDGSLTKDDNNNGLPLIQNIRAEIKVNNEETYYAFVSLPIIEYQEELSLTDKLISIDKKYYLNEIIYNSDGRNPIYNHNKGLKLNLPEEIASVEYIAKGGFDKLKETDLTGKDIYTYYESDPCFSLLETKDSQSKKNTIVKAGKDKDTVYILPHDNYSGSITNNRVEAWCYDENNKLVAIVYAPINMTLNTFGLASLNTWDGNTITIDDEGGYVMAPQIGAGEKDNNNRFTGILMGKTETYTGGAEAEKQIGLFGYASGLQSIFLDAETGNATFGLPDGYTFRKSNGITIPIQEEDNYGEGRIELRPGGESKIGGWKIGRHSLYYTMKPIPAYLNGEVANYRVEDNFYKYIYSGEIGPKYYQDEETPQKRQYANHHEKDIGVHDSGILLSGSPPYISVVGNMLTQNEISNSVSSLLREGDSIEIQLDPKTPTVFTIFRHNGEFRKQDERKVGKVIGDRTFLAGINARGQLQANILGSAGDNNNQISMFFDETNLFTETNKDYIGSIFEASTDIEQNGVINNVSLPYLKLLVKKSDIANIEDPDTTVDVDKVYISTPKTTFTIEDILRIYDD